MKLYYMAHRLLKQYAPSLYGKMFVHRRTLKYLVAGSTAAVVDVGLLYVFTDLLHIWYIISAVIAFVFAFCVSFTLQKFWTFRDGSVSDIHVQLGKYLVAAILNLILNTALMYLFVDVFHVWYIFSQIIIGLTIAVGSFFVYKKFIFKQQ